jgi:hypothetical protein
VLRQHFRVAESLFGTARLPGRLISCARARLWTSLTAIGPDDTVRLVTNDVMYTGGAGYTGLALGTDVLLPLHIVLDVLFQDITANSPVGPVVEGRIVGP